MSSPADEQVRTTLNSTSLFQYEGWTGLPATCYSPFLFTMVNRAKRLWVQAAIR